MLNTFGKFRQGSYEGIQLSLEKDQNLRKIQYNPLGSFSEESDKIGREFIKILETWQFGLTFNIIKHVFFLFWPKNFFCRFYEFLKNFGLAKKKIVKSRYWL
jgi:hypothetical protein